MKIGAFCAALGVIFTLAACSSSGDLHQARLNQKDTGTIIVRNGVYGEQRPSVLNEITPAAGRRSSYNKELSYKNDSPPGHCRLKDRFDRKELVAYNFSDGQSRVGLRLAMDGFSLSDAGSFDVRSAGLNFRYRFQAIKKRKEKCLYKSSWQGFLGSGYNEFFVREEQTVLETLDQEMDLVHDEFEKLFHY